AAVVPPFARLESRVRRRDGEVHLELTFEAERAGNNGATPGAVTRGIKVNGLATRATGLVGQLPVVYFSPGDVDLAGGPPAGRHRDDFTFYLDGVDLNTYGSRGQQRLAVLALKLAEADWMRDEIGELPVVLLDDVLSELDPQRREYVLRRVAQPEASQQRQVWITSTEANEHWQTHDLLRAAQ